MSPNYRFRSGLAVVVSFAALFLVQSHGKAANFLRGDSNGDGAVTISDSYYSMNLLS